MELNGFSCDFEFLILRGPLQPYADFRILYFFDFRAGFADKKVTAVLRVWLTASYIGVEGFNLVNKAPLLQKIKSAINSSAELS